MRIWIAPAIVAVGLLATAAGAAKKVHTKLPEGTAVVIVGRIASPPRGEINEQKMQVAVGPQGVEYTLHFRGSKVLKGPNGEHVDEDPFDEGQWVRGEGRIMGDPRRIKVSRIRLISTREMSSLRGNPYNRRGFSHGYLTWPAGEARVAGWRGQVYRTDR
jgi:hypothetical protein